MTALKIKRQSCLRSLACYVAFIITLIYGPFSYASDCRETQIKAPSPFQGNNDELVVLTDGTIWQIKYEYNYMYEYYPDAIICPSARKLIVNGKSLNVIPLSNSDQTNSASVRDSQKTTTADITVVFTKPGCDYFIADGIQGFYLLEWYGGHDPDVGDVIVAKLGSYGFKDVYYSKPGADGRVYVDDYLLSQSSVVDQFRQKCD